MRSRHLIVVHRNWFPCPSWECTCRLTRTTIGTYYTTCFYFTLAPYFCDEMSFFVFTLSDHDTFGRCWKWTNSHLLIVSVAGAPLLFRHVANCGIDIRCQCCYYAWCSSCLAGSWHCMKQSRWASPMSCAGWWNGMWLVSFLTSQLPYHHDDFTYYLHWPSSSWRKKVSPWRTDMVSQTSLLEQRLGSGAIADLSALDYDEAARCMPLRCFWSAVVACASKWSSCVTAV